MRDLGDGPEMQDRIADLEARLQRMEAERSMSSRSHSLVGRIVPPEASTHFRAASREHLMGVRALVDHWIRQIDQKEASRSSQREEIPID